MARADSVLSGDFIIEANSAKLPPMSIWGKLGGAVAGYALGGVTGALVGGVVGHYTLDRIQDKQVIFTIALISLAAKMTRADGTVSPAEILAVQQILEVPPHEQKNVARVFQLAQEDVTGFDTYARQVAEIYADSPQVLEDVLDVLFFIAYADGHLHPAEEEFLDVVAEIFNMSRADVERVRAYHDTETHDPYLVLGLERHCDNETARKAWREAVRENHPDQLQAHGIPDEMMHIANARMAAINHAWELIKEERGL